MKYDKPLGDTMYQLDLVICDYCGIVTMAKRTDVVGGKQQCKDRVWCESQLQIVRNKKA